MKRFYALPKYKKMYIVIDFKMKPVIINFVRVTKIEGDKNEHN